MGKFRKEGKKEVPQVSTSSLPDIVYMLIFFFRKAQLCKCGVASAQPSWREAVGGSEGPAQPKKKKKHPPKM